MKRRLGITMIVDAVHSKFIVKYGKRTLLIFKSDKINHMKLVKCVYSGKHLTLIDIDGYCSFCRHGGLDVSNDEYEDSSYKEKEELFFPAISSIILILDGGHDITIKTGSNAHLDIKTEYEISSNLYNVLKKIKQELNIIAKEFQIRIPTPLTNEMDEVLLKAKP